MIIRKMERNELEDVAGVYVQAWKETYPGMVPQETLDQLSIEKKLPDSEKDIDDFVGSHYVLLIKDEICGFVSCIKARDKDLDDSYGEIQAIYLLDKVKHQGYGGMLMDIGIAVLEQQHFQYVSLWVLESNTNAIEFYEHMGFARDGRKNMLDFDGTNVPEIRMTKKIRHFIVEEE